MKTLALIQSSPPLDATVSELIPPGGLAVALGLALFFGLAFEENYASTTPNRPGGVRTFPLLTLCGTLLWAIEPRHGIAFTAGALILGLWLKTFYAARVAADPTPKGTGAEIVVPVCNLLAYALGPVAVLLPLWIPVSVIVAATLLIGARERLHGLADRVKGHEIRTLARFLLLIGVILPLVPSEPITDLTPITPRQVWLAVVVVSSVSYASYLIQKYLSPSRGLFAAALLGGMYSSTATTVVLAKKARDGGARRTVLNSAIIVATTMMFVRIGVVVAVFDAALAWKLAPWLVGFLLAGVGLAFAAKVLHSGDGSGADDLQPPKNPLELGSALLFATLFTAVSLLTSSIESRYGSVGVYGLAALVGVVYIDPFVLSVAEGGVAGMSTQGLVAVVLVAASSNNLLKAMYALVFAGRFALRAVVALALLALGGFCCAVWLYFHGVQGANTGFGG